MNGTVIGSYAFYMCNRGFGLVGEPIRDCLNDGSWTPEEPTCGE